MRQVANRSHRVLSGLGIVLLSATTAAAQSGVPAENPAKSQAFLFERALRSAIEVGGQRLAQQALVIVPDLTLMASEPAVVRGVKLTGYGFMFDVQAPNITSTLMVWDMMRQQRPATPEGRPGQVDARQIASEGRVAATGPVAPDPMVTSPAAAPFDANRAYTNHIREALIDAVLDSSTVLQLAPDEKLTVVASGIDQPNSNPLYRASEGKLVLTIKASDLIEFRQGRLTREQAKERITQERF